MMITAILIASLLCCTVSLSLPTANLLTNVTGMNEKEFDIAAKEKRIPKISWTRMIIITSASLALYILKIIAWTYLIAEYTIPTIAIVVLYCISLYICITLHNVEITKKTRNLLIAGRLAFIADICYTIMVLATWRTQ